MADNTIDSLEIQISAAAGKALEQIDKLTGSLGGLKNALKFGNANQVKSGLDGVTKSAGKTATTLQSLSKEFLSTFGKVSKSGLAEAEQALTLLNNQMKAGIDISEKAKKFISGMADEYVTLEKLDINSEGLSEINELGKLAKDTLRELAEQALTSGASFRTMDNDIADFIHSYSKGTAKIKIPISVKDDIGDDFKSIRAKFGKAFTTKDLEGTPLDAVIKEIDSTFNTHYGELPISDAFRELGEVIDRARASDEKYREELRNDATTQNAISQAIEETISRFSELESEAKKATAVVGEAFKEVEKNNIKDITKMSDEEFAAMVNAPPKDMHPITKQYNDFKKAVDEVDKSLRKVAYDDPTDRLRSFMEKTTGETMDGKKIMPDLSEGSEDLQAIIDRIIALRKEIKAMESGSKVKLIDKDSYEAQLEDLYMLQNEFKKYKETITKPFDNTAFSEVLKTVGKDFVPADNIKDLDKQISQLESKLDSALSKRKMLSDVKGSDNIDTETEAYRKQEYTIAEIMNKLSVAKQARIDLTAAQAATVQGLDAENRKWYEILAAIREYKTTILGMESGNTIFNKEKYEQAVSGLKAARGELDQYKKSLSGTNSDFTEKLKNVGKDFTPAGTLKELDKQIANAQKNIAKYQEQLDRLKTVGVDEQSRGFKNVVYNITRANNQLDIMLGKRKELEALDNADPSKSKGINAGTANALINISLLEKTLGKFSGKLRSMSGGLTNILKGMYMPLKWVTKEYREKLSQIGGYFKNLQKVVRTQTGKIKHFWNQAIHSFGRMVVRRALYSVLTTIDGAMASLANFTGELGRKFNESMSLLTSDARYVGANLVAAFSPLVNAVTPMIDMLVDRLALAITYINQFFSALTGNNVYVKAKKAVTDYGESVKKATKAQKDLVLGIDELNINNPNSNNAGSAETEGTEFEYEEAPVLKKIKDFADKAKDIFAKMFDPLKTAWDRAGDYVISGFKYMVEEVGKLAADMGRDFLTVWQEEETIRIFENILRIIGDIEYTIGNLARNFRDAWNENKVGLQIFRDIRDIIGILIDHVHNVTTAFKEWSENVSFNPLLTSLENLLNSLKPVAEFIGGVFEDIFKLGVIPYFDYIIEEGAPHLMNSLAHVANVMPWEKMRQDLQPLISATEQLAENIHTGVANAISNVGESLAEFTGSEEFTKFIATVAKMINLIDAELVEKILTALGNCIIDLADALARFVGSDAFNGFIDKVDAWLDSLTVEDIEGIIKGLAAAIIGFKFTAFVGEGFVNFLKFANLVQGFSGAGSFTASLGSIAGALGGTAVIAVALSGHIYNLKDSFKELSDTIKNKDTKGLITGVGKALYFILNPLQSASIGLLKFAVDMLKQFSPKTAQAIEEVKDTFRESWDIVIDKNKSLRDAVESDTKANSKALRDHRKETEIEASELARIFNNIKGSIGTAFSGAFKEVSDNSKNIGNSFRDLTSNVSIKAKELTLTVSEKFKEIKENISSSMKTAKENLSQTWDNMWEKIASSDIGIKVVDVFEDIRSGIEDKINAARDAVSDAIEAIKRLFDFEWHWPEIKLPHFRIEGEFNLMEGRLPSIDIDWYANGGFLGSPSSYSLFGMGENGVPEILGTVGGRSAVAGGEEITGIRDQVYQSGVAEQALLNQAISLLQVIADKDFNVDLDGRSMVSSLNSRSSRNGYSMATIS